MNTFIYVLLFFAIKMLRRTHSDDKKFCIYSGMLLSLFAALSYDVGWDYVVYRDMIENKMDSERIELIEQALIKLSQTTGFTQLFFFVNHFVIVFCNVMAIRKSSQNVYLSFIVFLCLPLSYLLGISTIRAAAAASILFWGYEYFLKNNKPISFVLLGCVCFFIHESSFIFVLMLIVHYIKTPLYINIGIFMLAFSFSAANIGELQFLNTLSFMSTSLERFEHYSQNSEETTSKIPYIYYTLNVINFFIYKKLKKQDKYNNQYITLFNIGCSMSLIFSFNQILCLRFSRYFYSWIVLLVPYYANIFKCVSHRQLVRRAIGITCFMLLMYQLYLPNYNGKDKTRISTYWPYRLYIFED